MGRSRNPQKLEERRRRAREAEERRRSQAQKRHDIPDKMRRCDECRLPKWECELVNTGPDDHIFSPMSVEEQVDYEEQLKRDSLMFMYDDESQDPTVVVYGILSPDAQQAIDDGHFPTHQPGCTMPPKVCYFLSGIGHPQSA